MIGEFNSTIRVYEDGTFKMFNKDLLTKFLSSHIGETLDIIVRKKKTSKQRGYYWVLMEILGKEIGMSRDEVHEVTKFKFLREEVANEKTGEIFERIRSTKELSKNEMAAYIDQIIIWAADQLHINLPEAGEHLKINFEE